jgi:L-amino acid N-acyltransferase YncA
MSIIREAKVTDAAGITKVNVDTWRTAYIDIVSAEFLASLSYEERTPVWQKRLSDSSNNWSYFVAENEKKEVIGFIGGGPETNSSPDYTAELGMIYLLKAYQRKGIGIRLVATLVRQLVQQGHKSMLVWTFAKNPSRAFYEALGGILIGERTKSHGGADLYEVCYGWNDINSILLKGASDGHYQA